MAAAVKANSSANYGMWNGVKVSAPDGREVPVDEVHWSHHPGREGTERRPAEQPYSKCVDVRNRVMVELIVTNNVTTTVAGTAAASASKTVTTTRVVFQYYAAVENVNYNEYGYVLEGHIWHNPKSENQVAEVKKNGAAITAQISSVSTKLCAIL